MESPLPQVMSTSELAPGHEGGATPCSQQTGVLTKQAYIQLTWEAHSWRRHPARLVEREAALQAAVEALQATIRALNQRLDGTKSAPSAASDCTGESKPARARQRGQQPGSQGHGRSDRCARPVGAAGPDLSEAAKPCPACGKAFLPFPGTEASSMSEGPVQTHRRRLQRKRSHQACQCPQSAGIITAPPAPRLLPQSPLGVSVWTRVLLDKDR